MTNEAGNILDDFNGEKMLKFPIALGDGGECVFFVKVTPTAVRTMAGHDPLTLSHGQSELGFHPLHLHSIYSGL